MIETFRPIILGVDDDAGILEVFRHIFKDGYEVTTASDGEEALKKIDSMDVSVVLLDLTLPKLRGMEVLRRIKETDENIEVIIITASDEVEDAVEALKSGAFHYVVKPFRPDEIRLLVKKAIDKRNLYLDLAHFRSQEDRWAAFRDNISKSRRMQPVFEAIKDVSKRDCAVLIQGETGTGKELIARTIHYDSSRRDRPFVPVDCVALTETLIESELFGHEKGAFTGAMSRKLGNFEIANGGTLFLDEIGNLKPDVQAKLLRVLQEKIIRRVGGIKNIQVDFRIIAATNIDLKKAVENGSFRQDLFYRLNVIPIFVPPLRERREDIPDLVNYFLDYYSRKFGINAPEISEELMQRLTDYSWPGNVRELENVIERLLVRGRDTEKIISEELALEITGAGTESGLLAGNGKETPSLKDARDDFERGYIRDALEKNKWRINETADYLKLHRSRLSEFMKKFGIEPPE